MPRGLYIHVPFCASKCAYCDFYSGTASEETLDEYLEALIKEAKKLPDEALSTLYLGGGTPSLLGAERIYRLVSFLREKFGEFEEATLEANPADELFEVFSAARESGINRVSLGAQSANEGELRLLSRRHSVEQIELAVTAAKRAGIDNISLDIMLGIPEQTEASLFETIDYLCALEPKHISSYMLSLEEGTPLYKNREKYNFPSLERTADFYLLASSELEKRGYMQYEISNWAKEGFEARHNLNYWLGGEYYGLGPAAHGFIKGERYAYPSDLQSFISSPQKKVIDTGGGKEEYLMLNLRLRRGVVFSEYEEKFGKFPEEIIKKARLYEKSGLLEIDEKHIAFKTEGFLLFNELFVKLTEGAKL